MILWISVGNLSKKSIIIFFFVCSVLRADIDSKDYGLPAVICVRMFFFLYIRRSIICNTPVSYFLGNTPVYASYLAGYENRSLGVCTIYTRVRPFIGAYIHFDLYGASSSLTFLNFHKNLNSSFTSTLTPQPQPQPEPPPPPPPRFFFVNFHKNSNSSFTSTLIPPTRPPSDPYRPPYIIFLIFTKTSSFTSILTPPPTRPSSALFKYILRLQFCRCDISALPTPVLNFATFMYKHLLGT